MVIQRKCAENRKKKTREPAGPKFGASGTTVKPKRGDEMVKLVKMGNCKKPVGAPEMENALRPTGVGCIRMAKMGRRASDKMGKLVKR